MPTNLSADVVESFLNEVYLLSPTMGWWRGRYALNMADVTITVAGADALPEERVSSNSLKILTDKWPIRPSDDTPWYRVFARLESEKYAVFAKRYTSWGNRGVYVVPRFDRQELIRTLNGPLEEVGDEIRPVFDPKAQVQSLAYRFLTATEQFVASYPQLRQELPRELGPRLYKWVMPKLPTPARLRELFYFGVTATGVSNAGVDADDRNLDVYDKLVQEATRRDISLYVQEAMAAPRQELADTLEAVLEKVGDDRRVTVNTLNPVFEALDKFARYGDLQGSHLSDQIKRMRSELLGMGAHQIRREFNPGAAFGKLVTGLVSNLRDDEAAMAHLQEFGQLRRRIGSL